MGIVLSFSMNKFCFNCIVQWTKVVAGKHRTAPSSVKCPLCKRDNYSIIDEFDGSSFRQHYVNQDFGDSFILSRAHKYRLQCYYTEPGIVEDIFNISQYWKSHKYFQPNQWLKSWLRREIQALVQEEDVDIIVHHIYGVINTSLTRSEQKSHTKIPETKREEFKTSVSEAAKSFLTARTDRFTYEVELFLASGLNVEAYDAVYMQRLGWSSPGVTCGTSDSLLSDRPTVVPYLYIFDEDSDGNE
ncbi:RING zinc finger family protein [Quillaja saponaria]|uniref:RING zinc finger family protein n=1 Tax=Quillaja saponaria TaxID=32244 RepID=A0AAD7VJE5_QUISA|nr:RING zinc finger family protein [Quillaja saponaria]